MKLGSSVRVEPDQILHYEPHLFAVLLHGGLELALQILRQIDVGLLPTRALLIVNPLRLSADVRPINAGSNPLRLSVAILRPLASLRLERVSESTV
jgi:hypothetical protein